MVFPRPPPATLPCSTQFLMAQRQSSRGRGHPPPCQAVFPMPALPRSRRGTKARVSVQSTSPPHPPGPPSCWEVWPAPPPTPRRPRRPHLVGEGQAATRPRGLGVSRVGPETPEFREESGPGGGGEGERRRRGREEEGRRGKPPGEDPKGGGERERRVQRKRGEGRPENGRPSAEVRLLNAFCSFPRHWLRPDFPDQLPAPARSCLSPASVFVCLFWGWGGDGGSELSPSSSSPSPRCHPHPTPLGRWGCRPLSRLPFSPAREATVSGLGGRGMRGVCI